MKSCSLASVSSTDKGSTKSSVLCRSRGYMRSVTVSDSHNITRRLICRSCSLERYTGCLECEMIGVAGMVASIAECMAGQGMAVKA